MANRIKGITVEIGGDTTKLSKALEGVNKNIKNTQTQLKDVEKLLKLDPTNTELLSQKHKLLADSVSATKEKLETLKTAAEQANAALANGDISQEQYDALQREIIETEQELQRELNDILADCRSAFSQLSESEQANAAQALVGKNAMSGFLALMNAAPADIEKLEGAISNCDGISLQMANTMQDNLSGQLTILMSQLQDFFNNVIYIFSSIVINNYHHSRTVNQTNNSPKSLSELEIYRQTRNAVKE